MKNYNVTTTNGSKIQLVARNVFEVMEQLQRAGKDWVLIQHTN